MKNNILVSICLLCLLSFSSCIEEFKPDLAETEKKLVVNSFINNQESIRITVTESLKPGEAFNLKEFIDAKVSLYEDDSFLKILSYQKEEGAPIGYFTSELPSPSSNKKYKVIVEQEGFDLASASASVPPEPGFSNASVSFLGGNSYPFSFSINNTPKAEYYFLKMFISVDTLDPVSNELYFKESQVVEIPEGAIPNGQRYLDNGYIFTDESLKEGLNTLTGIAKAGIKQNSNSIPPDSKLQFTIHLESLSEEAYQFYFSHAASLISDTDFLSEVIPVYGNIENGLGIFAGIYISEAVFDIE